MNGERYNAMVQSMMAYDRHYQCEHDGADCQLVTDFVRRGVLCAHAVAVFDDNEEMANAALDLMECWLERELPKYGIVFLEKAA